MYNVIWLAAGIDRGGEGESASKEPRGKEGSGPSDGFTACRLRSSERRVSSSRGGRSVQNFRLFLVMMFLQFTGSRHKMLLSYVDLYLL